MRTPHKSSGKARPGTGMIDGPAARRCMIVGTVLQVPLAAIAHVSIWVELHALLFGAMMISAVAGYLYAQEIGQGYSAGAFGGLVCGGASGLFGIAMSVVLGDTDSGLFVQNALILAFTGGVGGLFGQMSAGIHALGR